MYLLMYILKHMVYKTKLQKWGNSLAIRIPSDIVRSLNLRRGSDLIIEMSRDEIIIKPERAGELGQLLDRITQDNIHKEVDWGTREGNEVW